MSVTPHSCVTRRVLRYSSSCLADTGLQAQREIRATAFPEVFHQKRHFSTFIYHIGLDLEIRVAMFLEWYY